MKQNVYFSAYCAQAATKDPAATLRVTPLILASDLEIPALHIIHGTASINMSSLLTKLPLRRLSRDGTSPSTKEEPEPKLKQIYAPRPLPAKRKRTLTLPLPLDPKSQSKFPSRKSKQHTSPQSECLFLQRLPYDIRRIIYEDVLCGNIFHILRMRRRLRHLRCSTEYGEVRDLRATCWGILMVDERPIREFYSEKRTDGGVVPLMRTCRAIYTETTPLLYTRNTFDLNGLESILLLSYTILPHRLNSITSLRLTWAFFQSFRGGRTEGGWAEGWRAGGPAWVGTPPRQKALFPGDEATWKACWKVIAGMQALRDLRVWLAMSPATEMPKPLEEEMLSPLRNVGPKRVFKVRVSWTLKGSENPLGSEMVDARNEGEDEIPYVVIRQEDQDWGAGRLRLQNV